VIDTTSTVIAFVFTILGIGVGAAFVYAAHRSAAEPATPPMADPAEIARLELDYLAKADQQPTVMPYRVSSVALPGTVPPPKDAFPAPAVIGAIVDPPAPNTPQKRVQELPDTGRHHTRYDPTGVEATRYPMAPVRRTRLEKTT